jgi:hypothetical protein
MRKLYTLLAVLVCICGCDRPAAYSDLVILRQPLAMFRQITGVLYETGEESPYERIDFAVFR